jgi:hypothetical protein
MVEQYKHPLNYSDFLPDDARNLLVPQDSSAQYMHHATSAIVVAHNVCRLGKDLFGYGIVRRQIGDAVVTLSAYGTKLEPFSSIKVEDINGLSYLTAYPDKLIVHWASSKGEPLQHKPPSQLPASHWSGLGRTKQAIEDGKQITAARQAAQQGGKLLQFVRRRNKNSPPTR